jgi:hypothetical protein
MEDFVELEIGKWTEKWLRVRGCIDECWLISTEALLKLDNGNQKFISKS